MLKSKLIDLINKNEVWAFVGSGVSVDSGLSTWNNLIDLVMEDIKDKDKIIKDIDFIRARNFGNFPECFSIIERFCDRDIIEKKIKDNLSKCRTNGALCNYLTDFPFKGYITTNYDNLIERILKEKNNSGWIPVGNTQSEIMKTTGNPDKLIWHIHGSVNLPKHKSDLILTQEDYDQLYKISNPILEHIKSLLTHNRLLFIGFGFNDFEMKRLLNQISLFCNPTRPAYAFLGFKNISDKENIHDRMMRKYNIDLIDYKIIDNSHKKLIKLLEIYSTLIIKRNQQFGLERKECPSYDPETTSLLIYNEFVLKSQVSFDKDMFVLFVQAYVLTILKTRSKIQFENLIDSINSRINLLSSSNLQNINSNNEFLKTAIKELVSKDLIITNIHNKDTEIVLTEKGENYFIKNHSVNERIKEQFYSSIESRLIKEVGDAPSIVNKITNVVISFINELIEKRSLGLQFVSTSTDKSEKDYHILALMQAIPSFISQLDNMEQALLLIKIIKYIFGNPTNEERKYIGISLQARFSLHLMGLDQNMLKVRLNQLKNSFYIIDSSILIPLLAISSTAHKAAVKLVESLRKNNCVLITTKLLLEEVIEHLRWAYTKIKRSNGDLIMIKYVLNKSGTRPNAFLNGYINEISKGKVNNFDKYLQNVFKITSLKQINKNDFDDYIINAFKKTDLTIIDFTELPDFKKEFYYDIEEKQEQIKEFRISHDIFKHDRQAKAEAIALTIIEKVREGLVKFEDESLSNGYFISNTKFLDSIINNELPFVIKPDVLIQIVASLDNWSTEELGHLTDSLVSEFHTNLINVIDYRKLRLVFSPYITASKKDYKDNFEHFKNIYNLKYGANLETSIDDVEDVDFPVFWDNVMSQITKELKIEIQEMQKELKEAKKRKLHISNKDWQIIWNYKRKKRLARLKRIERKNKK